MLTLLPSERSAFKIPSGLGGQSTSIYRRVLKKIYGAERGIEVATEMFKNPFAVVPVVMARLKQKDEEWRFTQVRISGSSTVLLLLTTCSVSGKRSGSNRPRPCI